MSKKLVKDLKENDICFFVYDDGVASIVNCDSIKKSNNYIKGCIIKTFTIKDAKIWTENNGLKKQNLV